MEYYSTMKIQPHDFTHTWDLRNKTNEQRKKRHTKKQTFFLMFNFERERESMSRGGTEKERSKIGSTMTTVTPMQGSNSQTVIS